MLTHCSPVTPYGDINLGNVGSGNFKRTITTINHQNWFKNHWPESAFISPWGNELKHLNIISFIKNFWLTFTPYNKRVTWQAFGAEMLGSSWAAAPGPHPVMNNTSQQIDVHEVPLCVLLVLEILCCAWCVFHVFDRALSGYQLIHCVPVFTLSWRCYRAQG